MKQAELCESNTQDALKALLQWYASCQQTVESTTELQLDGRDDIEEYALSVVGICCMEQTGPVSRAFGDMFVRSKLAPLSLLHVDILSPDVEKSWSNVVLYSMPSSHCASLAPTQSYGPTYHRLRRR